jgi:hypothetical protein
MLYRAVYLGVTLAALAGASASCRGAQPSPAPGPRTGTFDLTATPTEGGGVLRGVLQVLSDTVRVEFEHGLCWPSIGGNRLEEWRYECNGVGAFDRLNVIIDRRTLRGSWWGHSRVYRHRQVCREYGVNAQGQPVCVRMETETYEDDVDQSGVLHLAPRASAPS